MNITKIRDKIDSGDADKAQLELYEKKCQGFCKDEKEIFEAIYAECKEEEEEEKYVEEQQIIQENIDEMRV